MAELQEHLDAALNNFSKMAVVSKGDVADVPEGAIDITEDLFRSCSKIPRGELRHSHFHLCEAMSAIELMDPKMDIGMVRFQKKMGLDVCIERGAFTMDRPTLLSTLDATLCAFVTWLEGNSLAQTLWTNVLLTDPVNVTVPVLGPICHAFAHLVTMVHNILTTASVYEEEDFNGHLIYRVKSSYTVPQVIDHLKSTEGSLQKEAKNNKADATLINAIASRVGWVRSLMQALYLLTPQDQSESPDGSFKPKLRPGTEVLRSCVNYAKTIWSTWEMGWSPDNIEEDGDFGWLPAFEPEFNRKYLPPTFPRKSEMLSRETALPYLVKLSESLLRIPVDLPDVVHDLDKILTYLREYSECEFSTVFTRSVLQVVMLPTDDNVFGETPMSEIFIDTVRSSVAPTFLTPGTASYDDEDTQVLWNEFVSDCVRVLLNVIQSYGNNLARQREKMAMTMDDLSGLQTEGERCDVLSIEVERKNNVRELSTTSGPSLCTYVLYHVMSLACNHFELSFRLQLFAPYEYTYVYWYVGEIAKKWLNSTLERFQTLLVTEFKLSYPPENKKNDKKTKAKLQKKEERVRKRLTELHAQCSFLTAETTICDAMFKTTVALILSGKIRVPMWNRESESLRFEHRMLPFAPLGVPMHITYTQYRQMSKIDEMSGNAPDSILTAASEQFDLAKRQLERVEAAAKYEARAQSLQKICRNNIVVTRILASGQKKDSRVEFDFLPEWPMYPLLKLAN